MKCPHVRWFPREKVCLGKGISRFFRNGFLHMIAAFFLRISCIGQEMAGRDDYTQRLRFYAEHVMKEMPIYTA